jgi:hypothetical protein
MSSRKCPVCLEECFSEDTGEQILTLYAPSCHHGVCKECIRGIMKRESYNSKAIEDSSITEISGKLVYSDIQNGWRGRYFYKCPCCNDISKDYTVTFGRIFYEEDESINTKVISIEQSFNKNVSSFDEMMNKVQSLVSYTMKEQAERYETSRLKCEKIIQSLDTTIRKEQQLKERITQHNKKISILKKHISELEHNYQSRFNDMKKKANEEVRLVEEKKYKKLIEEEKYRINRINQDYIKKLDCDFEQRVDYRVEYIMLQWEEQKSTREKELKKKMAFLKYELEMEAKQNAEKIRTKYKEKMTKQLAEFDSCMDEYKEFLSRKEEFNQFKNSSKEYQEFLRFKAFSSN